MLGFEHWYFPLRGIMGASLKLTNKQLFKFIVGNCKQAHLNHKFTNTLNKIYTHNEWDYLAS